jgi:N-acyl-D-aspartate/D-glutamate deacylase
MPVIARPANPDRRAFLRQVGLAAAGWRLSRPQAVTATAGAPFEIALNHGVCYVDGRLRPAHVGVAADRTLRVSDVPLEAKTTIDASGLTVSPGFIDLLADHGPAPQHTYAVFEEYKVTDGVTTALQMHGGTADAARYYSRFENVAHRVNFGVSTQVMSIRNLGLPLKARLARVEANLDSGALGVSHSIEYQPTPFAELLEYARIAAKYARPCFLHLRYSSQERETEGVAEAIRLAREAGCHVHITHLHSTGGTYRMAAALELIRNAREQGLSLTACVYPYSYWATYLPSTRFDQGWMQRYGLDYGDLVVVGTGERLTEQSFTRYRQRKVWILVAVPEGTVPMADTVDLALREPFVMIGSDGGIRTGKRANNHPRGAACFSTAVRHGLSIGLSLEEVLAKLTTLPASVIGKPMLGRGVLQDGAQADMTVFEAREIDGRATVDNPNQYSAGIRAVIVNGRIAYLDGKLEERSGTPIRHPDVRRDSTGRVS